MNALQKTEFAILQEFVAACKKLELKYFLVCGSALGAAKYGGFVPWDDDIDVALPRKDYEIFCAKAPAILPKWCFVQNYKTDPEYHRLGTKLRDSRTTFIEEMCEDLKINHGVFIDVFPLDTAPPGIEQLPQYKKQLREFEAKRRVKLRYNRFCRACVFDFYTNAAWLRYRIFDAGGNTAQCIEKFDKFVSSFPEDAPILCNHANSPSPDEFFPAEVFGEGSEAMFEGICVNIPTDFNRYLTQKYGDWKADLPPVEQTGHHKAICNLTKAFAEGKYSGKERA